MKEQQNKSAREILGLEELTPLQTGEIRGGADKQKKKEQKVVIKCDCDSDDE